MPASTWIARSPWSGPERPPPTSSQSSPRPRSSASRARKRRSALQYGHGVGLSIWEKPIFSRLVSLDHPEELQRGHVLRARDLLALGRWVGAARIEEEIVVTADGCEVVTKFPAEELLVAGQRYFTVGRLAADSSRVAVPPQHQGRQRGAGCAGGVMRAAVYHGDHDVRIDEVPDPEPRDGEVLLRVLRSGMCGTDATEWKSGPRTFPVDRVHPVTGHSGPDDPRARVRR